MEQEFRQSFSDIINFEKVKHYENLLDDVMEIIDTDELKSKLNEIESNYKDNANLLNKTKLGIIYHEIALNLSFFSKSQYKGYAKKSFEILTELFNNEKIEVELLPFVSSYRASALSLVGAETKKLHLISRSFRLFDEAVKLYSGVSYLPEFMRGSVAENLPWFYFQKRKLAKIDFQSIIDKYESNPRYANWKVMSFTYWAWAKQRQQPKFRKQALKYLDKAISLDTNYIAGRKRSEELKAKMLK